MDDYSDKRKERRRRVFLRADLFDINGTPVTECAIQDTSRSGCRIMSDQLHVIPDDIVLTIRGLEETFTGRIVWRNNGEAGVMFTQEEQ